MLLFRAGRHSGSVLKNETRLVSFYGRFLGYQMVVEACVYVVCQHYNKLVYFPSKFAHLVLLSTRL